MRHYLTLLVTGLLLSMSGTAIAHSAGFAHPVIDSTFFHTLFHYLTLIGLGVGIFLFSRWLIRAQR